MLSFSSRCVAIAVLTLWPTISTRAEAILDQIPGDALGVAVVHDVAAASEKLERAINLFKELIPGPIPAPLVLIKASTGLGDGLNEQGDAMLVLVPGEGVPWPPRPLLFIPVQDYAAFAASINADATGEICRVSIVGEEVLVARRGSYAVLMNIEHRQRLEALLASEAKGSDALVPLADWLATTDVAVAVTPSGVELLTTLGRQGVDGLRAQTDEQAADPAMAEMLQQMQQSLAMYDMVLGFCGAEVKSAAVGLSIDSATNVRLSKRIVFEQEGEVAKFAHFDPLAKSPLTAFAANPFVAAIGGPAPEGADDIALRILRELARTSPEYREYTEKDWQEFDASYRLAFKGVNSASFVFYPGAKDDPLVSNIFGVIKADRAADYIAAFQKSFEKENELLKRAATDIALQYEFKEVTIGEGKGVEISVDIAAGSADPNVPMVEPIMKTLFGTDGVLRVYAVAANDQTVILAIATQDQVAEALQQAIGSGDGLASDAGVQRTAALLNAGAPWQAFVSPQGCVMWTTRLIEQFIGPLFGGGAPTIPEYPETPPVGFSLNLADGQLHSEMVAPVETLQGIAAFVKKVQEME